MNRSQAERGAELRAGVIAGLTAYTLWGVFPIYFKLVGSVGPLEVLTHRIVWAVPFGALIVFARRQWREVRHALVDRATLASLALAAFCISANWFIYIWAVQNERIFEASLGYYINPLVYVLVGVLFMGEKLRKLQSAAVLLAAAGVLYLTVSGGVFPWVAVSLALLFTAYGVIRKRAPIGAMPGLFVETMLLMPLALVWLGHLVIAGQATFGGGDAAMSWLLVLAGPLTVVPLLLFAVAARLVTLTTLGFMQFLAPTLQFLTGLWYGERLTAAHLVCFACIWIAVACFSYDALRATKKPPERELQGA